MITLFGKDEPTLLERLKYSVGKTRSEIAARVEGLLTGDRRLDAEQLRRLENALLAADLGVSTTRELVEPRASRQPTSPREPDRAARHAKKASAGHPQRRAGEIQRRQIDAAPT